MRSAKFWSAVLVLVPMSGCVADPPEELGSSASALSVCGGSIQAAIDAAPDGAVIDVCAGTYAERLRILGKRVALRGAGAGATIVDAGGGGRALEVRDAGAPGVEIRGIMFRGGAAGSGRGGGALLVNAAGLVVDSAFVDGDAHEGGGVAIEGGTIELLDNAITGNSAHRGGGLFLGGDGAVRGNRIADNEGRWTGGGIYVDNRAPVIADNTIEGNTSVNDGGGVYVHQGAPVIADNTITTNDTGDDGGGVRFFESLGRLERNVIAANHAADSGGGVRVSHLPVTIVDNTIRDNVATLGGGLDLDNDSSVLRGGEIRGNRATDGGGVSAGIGPWSGAVIEDVVIADNVASNVGGGLYLFDNLQPIALRGVTVRGNRAARGAGLYVRETRHTIANAIFAGNVATGDGGAIHLAASATTARYDFLTIHGNGAARGSAVWLDAPATLVDSILSQNAGVAVQVSVAPTYAYNDTWPASFAGMADPTGTSGNLAVDPRYVAAGDYRPVAGSPVVDAADPMLQDRNGTRADMGATGGPNGAAGDPPPPPPPVAGAVLEADAYVLIDQPGVNFGLATTLAADTSPATEAYLRFRVTNAGAITGARLRLTVTNPTGDAPAVRGVTGAWDETLVTWNTRPALGAVVADLGAVDLGVIEYDVSSFVTGDGVYDLALAATSTDGFAAWSREGSAPPVLVLTTGTPPPGATAVLEADTYAAAATPDTALGASPLLSSDADPLEHTFLRFRVTGLTAPPARVRLRMLCTDASSDGPALHTAANDWSEATLTWNARPALTSAPLADVGAVAYGQTVEYDVTSTVTADGTYTFALLPTSGSGFGVSSREGGTPPVLVIE